MKHIVSMDTGCLCKLKDTYEALDYIKKAGFKYFDLSLYWESACNNLGTRRDFKEETLKLKEYATKLGLKCIQSHSYFTVGTDEICIRKRKEIISQDIIITYLMGARIVVAHPIWEFDINQNVEFFKTFLPLLEKYNMIMAIENVWGVKDEKPVPMCSSTPKSFKTLLNKLNDSHYKVCLDIGHAEMNNMHTSCIDLIKELKDDIITLHIHDNDKYADLHQIPYTYGIDFDPIFKELKKVNYQGPINFEVERCYGHFPKELYIPVMKLVKNIGIYFKKLIY